jgi:hypothetical protein
MCNGNGVHNDDGINDKNPNKITIIKITIMSNKKKKKKKKKKKMIEENAGIL